MTLTATNFDLPPAPELERPVGTAAARLADVVAAYRAAAVDVFLKQPDEDALNWDLRSAGYRHALLPVAILAGEWNRSHGTIDRAAPPAEPFDGGIWPERSGWTDWVAEILRPAYRGDIQEWPAAPGEEPPYSDPVTAWRHAAFNARRGNAASRTAAKQWAARRDALKPAAQNHWQRLQPHIDARLRASAAALAEAAGPRHAPPPPTTNRRGSTWR